MAKRERPKIKSKLTPPQPAQVQQEELLEQLHKGEESSTKGKTSRFTMDIPVDIRSKMLAKTKANGQTTKGYILTLIIKDLAED